MKGIKAIQLRAMGLAALAGLALLGSGPASAQVLQTAQNQRRATEIEVRDKDGKVIKVELGDVLVLASGAKVTVTETTFAPPATSQVKVEKKGGEVVEGTVEYPPLFLSVSFFPLVSFGLAGPLQQPDLSFQGGTFTKTGALFGGSIGRGMKGGKSATELGGWYFTSYDGDADLYQLQFSYHLNPSSTFQVAYLNSTKYDAEGMTGFYIHHLRTAASGMEPAWTIDLGVGAYANFAPDWKKDANGGGRWIDASTLGYTTFVQAAVPVSRRVNATASLWTTRSRNTDAIRYSLGMSYKF